ncbi:hypothetical protein EDB92DRAFT_1621835 [Lactarius akahatsu]|uniref:Mid2 domain-containing protein n=1 Tax=Lactarius akahatsu TaxID=416441 RepID=A0AAD4LC49_9AGAM|nr:hypothetical protein EDB92DRAFT_1621835 [Lactarius akahatsu]
MRNSTPSATRILTVVSLVVLCTLSFVVVYGTQNIVDTPPQDSLFSFHKPDVPHHRRAIHHLRAQSSSNTLSLDPSSAPSSTPNTDSQSPPVQSTKSSSPTPVSSPTSVATSSTPSDSSTSSSKSTSTSQSSGTTTSTTSSTSTSSSTTSSTPSSSSTTSSPSSDTGTTTSSTPAISNSPLGGSTTRFTPNTPLSTDTFFTPSGRTSTISASSTAGATSKGFFANKAAVGVTFSIVGIICGLAAVMGIITVIRRYRRAHYRDDDFYEKYPRVGGSADRSHFSREPAELGQGPLGESATDLTTGPAPADAYPDRCYPLRPARPQHDLPSRRLWHRLPAQRSLH